MDKKIIFFDIDGTIYSSKLGQVTSAVKAAISRVQERGHLCFIASGRPYPFIAGNIRELGFDGYILANGAQIICQGREIRNRFLDYRAVKDLCRQLHNRNIEYILETPTACFLKQGCTNLLHYFLNCNIEPQSFAFDFDEEEIMHRTLKVEAWADSQENLEYISDCCREFIVETHFLEEAVEIYSKDVSKASGIRNILQFLNLPVQNSYCFGDGINDVQMFQTVGHAIAMGNGTPQLKELADDVCPDVENDGVAVKLNELLLQKIL